jgi:protein dithiol:quinone oxidoreductase
MLKTLSNLSTRGANLLGAAICVALLGYAYFSQYVMHLEPCPLCIFQRIGVLAVCIAFLIAAAHDPRGGGRKAYAGLILLAAAATIAVAAKHLWIQAQPPGTVAECGASLKFMIKVLPLTEVFSRVLNGSGECAKITWRFLGLSMPAWVLIAAAGLGGYGLWANLRGRPPAMRA